MNKRRWLITLCACALLFLALATFKYTQIKAAIAFGESFPEPSATVEAIIASPSLSDNSIHTIGEVIAPRSVDLRNELAGRIAAINFQSGQRVLKGDVLLQLDVLEETARFKAAQANVKLAKLELQRLQKLLKNKTVSQDQVDQSQAKFDIAEANASELAALIAKKTLTAPFDAIAGLHELDPGEYIQSNTHIVTLVGINDFVWIDFNLPIAQATLTVGSEIQLTLPGFDEQIFTAELIAKDSTVSSSSRNLRYRAKLFISEYIPANTIVNIALPGPQKTIFKLPVTALLKDQLGHYIFILKAEKNADTYRAERRSVIVDSQNEQMAAITQGLNHGELVATHGAFKLRNKLLAYVKHRASNTSSSVQP